MTEQTQSKKISKAIESVLKEWHIEELFNVLPDNEEFDAYQDFKNELVAAFKTLLPQKKEMSTKTWGLLGGDDEELNAKLEAEKKMQERVFDATGHRFSFGGSGKGEKAIKRLVMLETEYGMSVEKFCKWNGHPDQMYNNLKDAALFKNPMLLPDWMEAKADEYMGKTELEKQRQTLYSRKKKVGVPNPSTGE